MHIEIAKDYHALSVFTGKYIADSIRNQPNLVLGLPTGRTPIGVYHYLVKQVRQGSLSFKQVKTFNLDEYLGLSPEHPSSFASFMREHLFRHIDIDPENTHIPAGIITDAGLVCRQYEAKIAKAGGIDIQLLGLGQNGHIGFNEPGEAFESLTHVTELTLETRQINSSGFGSAEKVPRYAITMGLKTIMQARRILLMAVGEQKAEAVVQAIEGPVTAEVPASVLQLHPNCLWVLDVAAARLLSGQTLQRHRAAMI